VTALIAGCLLGLSGVAHCAAMCGPLVLLTNRGDRHGRPIARVCSYHAGRIVVYVLLSIPAAVAGQFVALAGAGRAAAALAGVVLVAVALGAPLPRWLRPIVHSLSSAVSRRMIPLASSVSRQPFLAGGLNGLLPCGLVYPAALTAAALGDVYGAVLFMLGFGLGTVPALLGVLFGWASMPLSVRVRLRRLSPASLALTGALLIAHGVVPPEPGGHAHSTHRFAMAPR